MRAAGGNQILAQHTGACKGGGRASRLLRQGAGGRARERACGPSEQADASTQQVSTASRRWQAAFSKLTETAEKEKEQELAGPVLAAPRARL